ncbi:hypothetical protein FRAAL5873 [Frankia alni ACN14a]|uniref:Uncharacterized protein n=1 Tax=Frankia alni (strain DSM 45986 / CECT 9034 / ACN14a) TaxID=326424 RepID=Q0RDH1_FRAAA|nr:hypothetical protein FRAAL5873 [Frankia alni ACN14a]
MYSSPSSPTELRKEPDVAQDHISSEGAQTPRGNGPRTVRYGVKVAIAGRRCESIESRSDLTQTSQSS